MSIAESRAKSAPSPEKIEMLTAYPASASAAAATPPSPASGSRNGGRAHTWLDLLDPTPEERASVESKYGLELPSREELSEVESSSRISEENGVLFLSIPIISHAHAV